MAIIESKVKEGKLVLGGTVFPAVPPAMDFSCQPTNVRLEPSFEDVGDPVETLCGDELSPDTKTTWALMGTAIQDWDASAPGGLTRYAYEHNGQTVDFAWQPNVGTTKVAGKVTVRALVIGGDVNTRLTHDFEWPATDVVPTWPLGPATGATAGTPGTWTPTGSVVPTRAGLLAGTPNPVTASPATAWTTGQYVQCSDAGAAGEAHWTGTVWATGRKP